LNVLVDQSSNMIMPEGGSAPVGSVVTVRKGEVFYRQPLGRSHAISVQEDVRFSFLGQALVISKDEQLIQSKVSGTTASLVGDKDALYCTPPKLTGKKRIVGLSEVAEVGMDFDALAKLRHVQTQSCLIDAGSDGTADKAFFADTSNRNPITPVAIAPTPIRKLGIARMPGESEIRILFNGPAGILGNMSVSLQIVEEGKFLSFRNGQTFFKGSAMPNSIESFGGRFTLLSYDSKAKSAEIRIDRPFTSAEYGVRTVIQRRY
jgi:hypothetical protein